MQRISAWFLVAAATCLVVSVCMEIAMDSLHDFRLAPAHAHLNLFGWTSLGLMGLAYRAWPELAATRGLALTQFALSAGAAVLFPLGLYPAFDAHHPMLANGMAVVWLAGAVLFLAQMLHLAVVGRATRAHAAQARDARMAVVAAAE